MNKTLPIYDYKEEIVNAVNKHAVTIITAETGSGKSTQTPQFLEEAGYKVVVTEPRRMAAWSLAERVAEETATNLGEKVGFRTAFERKDSPNSSILYCTDGLELVKVLADDKESNNTVLVIDEVHEWNLNIETLIAWSKKKISEGWNTKVVIMSATLEKEDLKKYFGQDTYMLQIPGKLFPVEFEERFKDDLIPTIKEMICDGHNTLVFVPGKREIEEVIEQFAYMKTEAVVLPLHGELDSLEQRKCFKNYSVPKLIVATNVAQTSITISDIDAVVDTGTERCSEVHDGVQGLFLRNTSKADCMQRKGRAGRTKEGRYVLCSNKLFEEREEFSTPEIQRGILDQIVLRLATCGIDATELEFFHQPSKETLVRSKQTLINLGALTKDNKVTPIGYKMAKMPVSVRAARMIIEAEKLGVTEQVICIAAIKEIGGLLNRKTEYYNFTKERSSDLLAEFDVWNKLQKMQNIKFSELGINKKSYFRIQELIEKMNKVLEEVVTITSSDNRDSIKKACIAGMIDQIHKSYGNAYMSSNANTDIYLDKHSCFVWNPRLVVGTPRIIEFKDSWGYKRTMNLISMATEVTVEDLEEIAPQLLSQEDVNPYYSCSSDTVIVTRITYFNNVSISEETISVPNHPQYAKLKEEYENTNKEKYYQNKRQEIVCIDGKTFEVSYDWRDNAQICIDKETLFNTNMRVVTLDNGKQVDLYCGTKKNKSVVALKNAVESEMIKYAWKEKRNDLPSIKASNIASVLEVMEYLGKQKITYGNGGYGDPIYGFGCLVLEKNSLHLELLEDEAKAKEKTQEATEFLYNKFIKQNFSEKKFKFKKGIKGLSRKETKVKEEFDLEVHEMLRGLEISNIEERVSYLQELYEVLIEDLQIVA